MSRRAQKLACMQLMQQYLVADTFKLEETSLLGLWHFVIDFFPFSKEFICSHVRFSVRVSPLSRLYENKAVVKTDIF